MTTHSDHLIWPFFDDSHRKLVTELHDWCRANLGDIDYDDTLAACRTLVQRLGEGVADLLRDIGRPGSVWRQAPAT